MHGVSENDFQHADAGDRRAEPDNGPRGVFQGPCRWLSLRGEDARRLCVESETG